MESEMSREAGAGGAEDTQWTLEGTAQHSVANGREIGRRGGRRGGGNDQARWREATGPEYINLNFNAPAVRYLNSILAHTSC